MHFKQTTIIITLQLIFKLFGNTFTRKVTINTVLVILKRTYYVFVYVQRNSSLQKHLSFVPLAYTYRHNRLSAQLKILTCVGKCKIDYCFGIFFYIVFSDETFKYANKFRVHYNIKYISGLSRKNICSYNTTLI